MPKIELKYKIDCGALEYIEKACNINEELVQELVKISSISNEKKIELINSLEVAITNIANEVVPATMICRPIKFGRIIS